MAGSQSLDRIPTSSIQWKNKEELAQVALAAKDFKKWRTAWDDIESAVQRGYLLFCLLTGVRPGEALASESKISTVNAKAGKDITLPMTRQIEYSIDLALGAPPQNPTITMKGLRGMEPGEVRVVACKRPHHEIIDPDLIFPGETIQQLERNVALQSSLATICLRPSLGLIPIEKPPEGGFCIVCCSNQVNRSAELLLRR